MLNKDVQSLPFLTRDMLAFEHATAFSLICDVIATNASAIQIKGATREGPFTLRIVPVADGTQEEFIFNIPDVPIFLTVTGFTTRSDMHSQYIEVQLGINRSRSWGLIQGFVSGITWLTWPVPMPTGALEKRGQILEIFSTNPAAGAEQNFPVPAEHWLKVKSIRFTYVNTAAAASRRVSLRLAGDTSTIVDIPQAGNMIISETWVLTWGEGLPNFVDSVGFTQTMPLPSDLILPPTGSIKTVTTAINGADDMGAMTIYAERLLGV